MDHVQRICHSKCSVFIHLLVYCVLFEGGRVVVMVVAALHEHLSWATYVMQNNGVTSLIARMISNMHVKMFGHPTFQPFASKCVWKLSVGVVLSFCQSTCQNKCLVSVVITPSFVEADLGILLLSMVCKI